MAASHVNRLFNMFINSGSITRVTLPSGAAGATVTFGKAWAAGTWKSLGAALGADRWLDEVVISQIAAAAGANTWVPTEVEIDIGTGAPGSEVAIAKFAFGVHQATNAGAFIAPPLPCRVPIFLPSGTALSARGSNSANDAGTCNVKVAMWAGI
jgi:hypothetical protein